MTSLSRDQIQLLKSYSIYIEQPAMTLFKLSDLFNPTNKEDAMNMVLAVSGAPSQPIAASYFMKRYGMFVAMQFYMLTTYDEIWDQPFDQLTFSVKQEFGTKVISMFANSNHWRSVDEHERVDIMKRILNEQCFAVIQQLRSFCSVSPLVLWENVFGYMLWHYHTLVSNPAFSEQAMVDLTILQDEVNWQPFADKSYFAEFLQGFLPSQLINKPVRKTCCHSKDIPGWMQCGFCPLK